MPGVSKNTRYLVGPCIRSGRGWKVNIKGPRRDEFKDRTSTVHAVAIGRTIKETTEIADFLCQALNNRVNNKVNKAN